MSVVEKGNKMEKILTIAVPAYNIENYIEKNIVSFQKVKEQYKPYFEVLIINDGSTDRTVEVATNLIQKDTQLDIRIIDKENGGHGSAVNKGIELATGKYFKVIDGDDWVNPVDFETFIERLNQTDVDFIITNFTEQHVYENREVFVKAMNVADGYQQSGIPAERIFMHSITYKTSILKDNNIKLSEGIFYVDIQYANYPLEYINSYVYWDLNVYQYLLGRPDQSMAWKSRLKNELHHLLVTESMLSFYDKVDSEILKNVLTDVLNQLINSQYLISGVSTQSTEHLMRLTKAINESSFNYLYDKHRKTSFLMYINEKTNHRFSFLLNHFIQRKLSEIRRMIGVE